MQNLFADKLGFIYSAGDFLGNVLDSLSDLFSGSYLDGSMIITLPALSFNFLGFSIHLWDDTSINLTTLISGTAGISILYNIYKVMLHVFLYLFLLVTLNEYIRGFFIHMIITALLNLLYRLVSVVLSPLNIPEASADMLESMSSFLEYFDYAEVFLPLVFPIDLRIYLTIAIALFAFEHLYPPIKLIINKIIEVIP